MKDKSLIISLVVALGLSLLAIIILIFLVINKNIEFKASQFGFKISSKSELIIDEVYDNKYDVIELSSNMGSINVKSSNDDKIRLVINGHKKKLDIKDNDKKLVINYTEEECIGICVGHEENKIDLYLPKTYDKDLVISNKFGNIKVKNNVVKLVVNADCGNVEVNKVESATISSKYGNITVNEAKTLNINEDCGDVEINKVSDIVVKNKYGDIEINEINNAFTISNDCGDVKVKNIEINEDSSIKSKYGDVKLGNTNEIYIDAQTSLGSVSIKNNYRKADITLKIKNDCGDIKVNN